MATNTNFVNNMLDILEYRVSSIANSIIELNNLGFIPNKKSNIVLEWSNILIHAYKNYNIFTDEQKNNINILFRKVSDL